MEWNDALEKRLLGDGKYIIRMEGKIIKSRYRVELVGFSNPSKEHDMI